MTITDELHFSVLSAPLAAADRRLFSQAWYSALYGTKTSPAAQAPRAVASPPSRNRPPSIANPSRKRSRESIRNSAVRSAAAHRVAPLYSGERRAPRLDLARKIERFVLQPGRKATGATFTLEGARGSERFRVRVLVRADGERVCLIALCSQALRATVAAALAQARYALASRGMTIVARTWEGETC